jgi:hypothetical protein
MGASLSLMKTLPKIGNKISGINKCGIFYPLSFLCQLFRNLFHKQGFIYDYSFDWNMLKFSGS